MTIFAAHCSNATDKQDKRLKWTIRKFHKKAGRMWQHEVYKEVIVSNFLDGSENFYNQITQQYPQDILKHTRPRVCFPKEVATLERLFRHKY